MSAVWSCIQPGPVNQKEKDVTKSTSDLSEDLFKVHDFDVKIDLQFPSAGECVCVCVSQLTFCFYFRYVDCLSHYWLSHFLMKMINILFILLNDSKEHHFKYKKVQK